MLTPGIYEQIISTALAEELDSGIEYISKSDDIDSEEASQIIAKYVMLIIEKCLNTDKDNGGDIQSQINIANNVIDLAMRETKGTIIDKLSIDKRGQQLYAIAKRQNSLAGLQEKIETIRPESSISQSTLFTGSIHEPSLYSELKKEIVSSDRIYMLVSFIKWSGLRLIYNELSDYTQNGGHLRVITTSYMGATDLKAIEMLSQLQNTEIRVSFDTKRTRLHAKSYIFYRNTGFSTAYVGSSNLSNAAISSGLEWNVKVAAKDLPDTIQKIEATFESYWNSSEFVTYNEHERGHLEQALRAERNASSSWNQFNFDISPYPFQQEILDRLDAEREIRGYYKNLIVAATGTGKTVISALDYKKFVRSNQGKPNRLLFVAHREEILKQSQACFQMVLKDQNFGNLFVGNNKPDSLNHLFLSIQTFNSQEFERKIELDFYDYIVVDEFHHAAAPTYQKLLQYFSPKILLGLTATPERMDGKDILEYFDNRIAAEIRLPEAIDRKLLCPFQYFGVTDTVDLNDLRWSRGGYDRSELTRVYSIDRGIADRRAGLIIQSIMKYVTDINDVKGLGFCVSVEHANYMAEYFNGKNIPSISLTGQSADDDRNTVKQKLTNGEIRFIFVVDIYNEGVDIPEINTVLFLRPTESLTIFLQQLGRGLRLSENKECLTVLDFIGQANRKYNFEDKFAALLSNTTRSVQHEIKNGFSSLPKGCYIQLEKKARDYIFDNIRQSFGNKLAIVSRISTFEEDTGKQLTLKNFSEYYHLDVKSVVSKASFARLCVMAKMQKDFYEDTEEVISKALPRISFIDSRKWINFLLEYFSVESKEKFKLLDENQVRMLRMFQFSIWPDAENDTSIDMILFQLNKLRESPVMFSQIIEMLRINFDRIDFIDESVNYGFKCPLDLHCTYTRDQILVAMDFMRPSTIREGVKYLQEKKSDIFFITLNKSDKDYSPTTMYNDYSINDTLFHWQSQSTTSVDSPTGKRYRNHKDTGNNILLFVREHKKEGDTSSPYTFLGLADFVKNEGSRPMNITWKLHREIPGVCKIVCANG